jgi:osmotically-inducible protein OsmY
MTAMTRSIPTVLRVLLAMVRRSVRTELFALLFVLTVPAQLLQAAATGWVGDDHAAARLITAVAATGSGSTIDDKDAAIMTRVNEQIAKDAYPKKAGIHAQTNAGVVSLSGEV